MPIGALVMKFSNRTDRASMVEEALMSRAKDGVCRTDLAMNLDVTCPPNRRSRWLAHSLVLLLAISPTANAAPQAAKPGQPPTTAAAKSTESERFAHAVDAFVRELGRHYPTEATELGLHEHDADLEDLSPAGIQATLGWLSDWERKLLAIGKQRLKPEEQFDLDLLRHAVAGRRFELTELPTHRRKPLSYTGLVSHSVNALLKRNYAPLAERLKPLISRLRKATALIRQAPQQLDQMSLAAIDVTLRTLPATTEFFRSEVVKACAQVQDAQLQKQLRSATTELADALTEFGKFLEKDGKAKATADFALGEARFQRALFAHEMIDAKVADLLPMAEAELARLRAEFDKTAAKIDAKKSAAEVQLLVSQDHPQRHELLDYTASRQAAQRKFLIDHNIVTVPSEVLPLVRETPPFMRATTLASMDTPGPYEKASEAYYYITLPDPAWKPAEAEDFLRGAHNRPLIDVVTVHEAFPGHYVQYLWLGKLSKVRQVAHMMANVEGWAHYTEEMMMEEGYGSSDPRIRLMQLQDALLRAARFVAGIRMHCRGMTQAQAADFFFAEGKQMRAVAEVEARRGTQDPLYIVYTYGKLQILKLRADYKAQQGANYSLRKFHDTLLGYGRAPLSMIRQAMLGK